MTKFSLIFFNIKFILTRLLYKRVGFFRRITFNNYKKVKKRIVQKKTVTIAFLVCDNSKWQYQSLYEEFAQDPYFNPIILVVPATQDFKVKADIDTVVEMNYSFFKSKGMNVKFGYCLEERKYICLSNFNVDLVFYLQPWDIAFIHHPVNVSKFALTYYFPYGFQIIYYSASYTKKFHSFIYNMFVEDESHIDTYKKKVFDIYSENCIVVGNPKLDVYLNAHKPNVEKYWKFPENFKIIYAPHHSFENDWLATATFRWSGQIIMDLMKKYQASCEWIIKPHPLFESALVRHNIMTKDEVQNFYNEWQKLGGGIYKEGNYFDLFKTSDMLVTDSISFLGEYAPTQKPVLHMVNHVKFFNDFGFKIIDNYYRIKGSVELMEIFEKVVVEGNDYMKAQREANMRFIFKDIENVSALIKKIIYNDIKQ